jgi:hypothetical protein
MSDRVWASRSITMAKRDRFISELQSAAKARDLPFRVETWRGKGGHAMV